MMMMMMMMITDLNVLATMLLTGWDNEGEDVNADVHFGAKQ